MKILIFSTAYLPKIGGAEIAFKEITDRIGDYDFDLITARFSRKSSKKKTIGNITIYRVGWGCKLDKYLLPILGYFKAKKLNKKQKHSLIWSISASQAGLAALFFKLKKPKIPFLLTVQEGSSPKRMFKRRWMVWPLIKKIFKKADYIQAISRFLADFSKQMGARCKIEIVPNGANINKFKIQNHKSQINSKFKIQNFKNNLGIKKSEKVVITISRLVEKNGVGDLIDAAKILKKQNINFKLLIIGTGHLKRKIKSQITNNKLESKVLFLGLIAPKDIPKYLAISDVFVRPSISEGFGNVFVEAMAAGVPIVGTPVGGIPDFLKDGETGIFCQPKSPKSIASAIKTILNNKELQEKLIKNGKKLVNQKYDWNIIASQMNKIFNKLCAS